MKHGFPSRKAETDVGGKKRAIPSKKPYLNKQKPGRRIVSLWASPGRTLRGSGVRGIVLMKNPQLSENIIIM